MEKERVRQGVDIDSLNTVIRIDIQQLAILAIDGTTTMVGEKTNAVIQNGNGMLFKEYSVVLYGKREANETSIGDHSNHLTP